MTNNKTILDILRTIQDPQLKKDLVSLGMVRDIQIRDGYAHIHLEISMNMEGVRDFLKSQITEKTKGLKGIKEVTVEFSRPKAQSTPVPSAPAHNRDIQYVVAVASGKGGVGKTTVAVNLALALSRLGHQVGLMDGDIYGPNVPLMLGVGADIRPTLDDERQIIPIEIQGLRMISMGILVPADQPMVWRGPKLHGVISQFVQQVAWGVLDFLLVDLPPGTGDVQLSLVQNVALSGAVIVTTPQEVALMDVRKGIAMFKQTNVPILGIIENMTGEIFGCGGGRKAADQCGAPYLGEIPLDPRIRIGGDGGHPVVTEHPDSPAAQAFFSAAKMLSDSLSKIENLK